MEGAARCYNPTLDNSNECLLAGASDLVYFIVVICNSTRERTRRGHRTVASSLLVWSRRRHRRRRRPCRKSKCRRPVPGTPISPIRRPPCRHRCGHGVREASADGRRCWQACRPRRQEPRKSCPHENEKRRGRRVCVRWTLTRPCCRA